MRAKRIALSFCSHWTKLKKDYGDPFCFSRVLFWIQNWNLDLNQWLSQQVSVIFSLNNDLKAIKPFFSICFSAVLSFLSTALLLEQWLKNIFNDRRYLRSSRVQEILAPSSKNTRTPCKKYSHPNPTNFWDAEPDWFWELEYRPMNSVALTDSTRLGCF